MPKVIVTVGGVDLSTLGFELVDPEALWDSIFVRNETEARPNTWEAVSVTTEPQVDPRTVELQGILTAATLAQMNSRIDSLHFAVSGGPMVLSLSDRPTRVLTVLEHGRAAVRRRRGNRGRYEIVRDVVIPFLAPDPRLYDSTVSQSVALSTVFAATPLGNARVGPLITGLGATETVEYMSPGGAAVLASIGWAGVAAPPVTLDLKAKTAVDNNGLGIYGDLVAGYEFFELDPHDGDFLSATWPGLRLQVGTGSADYARAWRG